MLAHSPGERLAPLDVANVLAEAGNKIGGDGVAVWAARRWGQAGIQEELPTVAEVLEAPAELGRVFNKTGQYSRRQSASAKGESTAFWSRDKINAMLDDGDDPLAGSQMFQRRDLQSMLARDEDSAIRHIPARQQRELEPAPWNPDSTISGRPEDPELAQAMADLKRQAATNAAPPPPLPPPPPASAPTPAPRAAPPLLPRPPPRRGLRHLPLPCLRQSRDPPSLQRHPRVPHPTSPSRGFPSSSGPSASGWSWACSRSLRPSTTRLSRPQRPRRLQRHRSRSRWPRLRMRPSRRPLQSLGPSPRPERVPARRRPPRLV